MNFFHLYLKFKKNCTIFVYTRNFNISRIFLVATLKDKSDCRHKWRMATELDNPDVEYKEYKKLVKLLLLHNGKFRHCFARETDCTKIFALEHLKFAPLGW